MIEVTDVVKTFDGYRALDGVSFTIPEGCIYGMVGSNGAGKSTMLRLLSGIYRADQGEIRLDGKPVYENEGAKEELFFVPDELFFLHGANLNRMEKMYRSIYKKFDTERFHFLAESFHLDTAKPISTFSKGMKRQAATILALSTRANYYFFDETFDGLDPVMRNLVKNLICQEVAERRISAIITSHSLREMEDTCDQLALLHKGGIIMESDVTNLKTSLFKVQIAFAEDYDRDKFPFLDILHFFKRGSVSNMIVRGDRTETTLQLESLHPLLVELLPLTLEEIFTYEMEAVGYAFNEVFMDDTERQEAQKTGK